MAAFTIRQARRDDPAARIANLIWTVDIPVMAFQFGSFDTFLAGLAQDWAANRGAEPPRRTLVAEAGGEIVGLTVLHSAASLERAFEEAGETLRAIVPEADWAAIEARFAATGMLFEGVPEDAVYVLDLAVDAAWHGRGVGRALIAAATDRARRDGARRLALDVAATNPALAFYQRIGLQIVGQVTLDIPVAEEDRLHYRLELPLEA